MFISGISFIIISMFRIPLYRCYCQRQVEESLRSKKTYYMADTVLYSNPFMCWSPDNIDEQARCVWIPERATMNSPIHRKSAYVRRFSYPLSAVPISPVIRRNVRSLKYIPRSTRTLPCTTVALSCRSLLSL